MNCTCDNCLNAYNNPYQDNPLCQNKEWEAQFRNISTVITKNGTCGTWTQRKRSQPKLNWPRLIQLQIDFE